MKLAPNTIHQGDCLTHLRSLPAGSVDLVFADPPFNIGYDYDVYDDKLGYQQYLDWSAQWIGAVYEVLQPQGTFWLAIGDEYAAELKIESQKAGFICRSWVIWYYTFGVNCAKKFTRSHAHLFHFVKDRNAFTFRDEVLENRIPSARELVYNDRRANPQGRLPDDTWIIPPADASGMLMPDDLPPQIPASHAVPDPADETYTLRPQEVAEGFQPQQDTWHFSRVAGTFKERAGFHGCQMPEQLLGRIIRTCSHPDELVLDPFSGSATTLAVAKKLGRRFLGFELSEQYAQFGRERLAAIAVDDPLTGAPEPTKAAFAARQAAGSPAGKKRGRSSKQKKAASSSQPLLDSLDPATASEDEAAPPGGIEIAGLAAAFEETREGFSADRVVADPTRNAAFVGACGRRGLAGDAKAWNIALLRLRKTGKLAHLVTTRRTERPLAASSPFLHAAEIALQQLLAEGLAGSLDEVLCDPALAAAFDARAQRFAAEIEAFELRWAALQLRKLAKTARVQGMRLAVPPAEAWQASQPLSACDPAAFPAAAGLYLIEAAGQPLYAGETLDLRARFEVMAAPASQASWQTFAADLSVTLHPGGLPAVSPLAGQACLTQHYQPPLNYRELGRPAE